MALSRGRAFGGRLGTRTKRTMGKKNSWPGGATVVLNDPKPGFFNDELLSSLIFNALNLSSFLKSSKFVNKIYLTKFILSRSATLSTRVSYQPYLFFFQFYFDN